MSVNKQIVVGNVGQEPEERSFPSGDKYMTFSVATNENWKDKESGEKKTRTTWHRFIACNGLAGIVKEYVKAGDEIYLEGVTRSRTYQHETHKDVTQYVTEVYATEINLLRNGHRSESSVYQDNAPSSEASAEAPAAMGAENL